MRTPGRLWFTILLLCFITNAPAQETKHSYWVGAGFGPAAIKGAEEIVFGGSGRLAFAWAQTVVSLSAGGGRKIPFL